MPFTLAAIQQAWSLKDPALVDYMVSLAQQKDPQPAESIRDEALTFPRFLRTIFSYSFRQLSTEEQYSYRVEQLALLTADDAAVPLADSLKLHSLILFIYADDSFYARRVLIEIIRTLPLQYGVWKALKIIYKDAEKKEDHPLLGELIARFDAARANNDASISHATLLYMVRRGWRYLRKLGESLPVCYPDAAAACLAAYPDNTQWSGTWVANHIWHHQRKNYGMAHFGYVTSNDLLKNRAFVETWQRSPEPLLRLLSTAHSEKVRQYACNALTQNFKFFLRDIDTQWIIQLAALPVESAALDGLLVWLLKNSPKLEQQQFRTQGLHEVVVGLLTSKSNTASAYACQYVSTYARDIALDLLLQLMNNTSQAVRKLAKQLLSEREPRNEVGLDAWGQLLEYKHSNSFASSQLRRHFGRKELSAAWFQQRLLSATYYSVNFSKANLLELHPLKTVDVAYFQTVLVELDLEKDQASQVASFCLQQLEALGLQQLSAESVQTYLLHPLTSTMTQEWLDSDRIEANSLPIDFYQALVYEPSWDKQPFIQSLRQSDQQWGQALTFSVGEYHHDLGMVVRRWLSDVRRFNPADLGFEWLMQLVDRVEEHYHQFAVDIMIKAFVPADFAQSQGNKKSANPTTKKLVEAITVNLQQQSFVFTGKLKTMMRKEAQAKVTTANGKNASAVNGKLNYLVIGDEGSPFYGDGKKGSKQLKAETLMAKVETLSVISETAFLQMLTGETPEFSADDAIAGCRTLWTMATENTNTPVGKFALTYLRHHHPDLCLKLTSRPVDPHAALPEVFISFDQFESLFSHAYTPLRHFALSVAKWEFARWQPASAQLIALCESKYADVREFIHEALLTEPTDDNKRYRLSAETLEVNAVYQFCNSKKAQTRQLGMQIIQQYETFQQPEALFQLTESPDREIRSFVVRILWSLYRHYATTSHWQPYTPVVIKGTKALQKKQQEQQQKQGAGLPMRPKHLPADKAALQQLLQRWLYELPPGGFTYQTNNISSKHLRPLSACLAKKALIETFRDVALEDDEFARMILPLLQNFTQSRGAMEQAACLVAVTRIKHTYPQLATLGA